MTKSENAIVIKINADDSAEVDYLQGKSVIHKVISAKEALSALIQSSRVNCVVNSGFLPKNCAAFSRDVESGDSYFVIEHTERKADIIYHETMYKDFPLPRLVFGFGISSEGKVRRVNVAVVDEDAELNEDTPTYRYPFSNVSGFAMCTGANKLPVYKKTQTLKNLPYYLIGIPNNDDHYSPNNNMLNLGHRELLEHLKDKPLEYYYSNVLVKSRQTLKNFI